VDQKATDENAELASRLIGEAGPSVRRLLARVLSGSCASSTLNRRATRLLALVVILVLTGVAHGAGPTADPQLPKRIIRVGKTGEVRSIAEASRLARSGDVVEIEAGEYTGDVAVWAQKELTIRGVNGVARLVAAGASAEGKGIWVVRGDRVTVENVAFVGTRVPSRNGAGIRLERGSLTIRNCLFEDNENGILTGNDAGTELVIERSEFARNGAGDGQTHNLYAGNIARLAVTGSYFHAARVGHLLKSRARESDIRYSRLTDEASGSASYELEFPAGGVAVVLGNLIEQGQRTENAVIVSMGAEGYPWPRNELYFTHNTVVNDRAEGGVFIAVKPGDARARVVNNLFVGKGTLELNAAHELVGNENAAWSEFAMASRLDFRLKAQSRLVGRAQPAGAVGGLSLRPEREYVHPTATAPLPAGTPLSPGAFQRVFR
jgi:Right handed beta helix region